MKKEIRTKTTQEVAVKEEKQMYNGKEITVGLDANDNIVYATLISDEELKREITESLEEDERRGVSKYPRGWAKGLSFEELEAARMRLFKLDGEINI